ncbi:MAG: hypothetical protein LQ351_004175 [Letrouitia transgressa]|nr:MAG: hypothetical protein LQ351_004175 [Letrouitia transgressa]
MASEGSPTSRSVTPSVVPQKRAHGLDDEQHVPAVSSPLNPDYAAIRSRKPPPREQREKKESLKKREAKGADSVRSGTPDSQSHPTRKTKKTQKSSNVLSPLRYPLPQPIKTDWETPRPPVFNPFLTRGDRQFHECFEHISNKKGFRYTHCIADPAFATSKWYRQTETEPFAPRFSIQDASSHIYFDSSGQIITTDKGFRMARANVGAREGRWYYECKILSGIKPPNYDPSLMNGVSDDGGHVRIGWARREASLDTPVGFDAYSYGLRDVAGQKMHMSRPKDFMPDGESFCEGDVIGLEITLPSLALHRKVVEGSYNKAVDVSDDLDPHPAAEAADIIRDRIPIRYKGVVLFEQFEYHSTKDLEELMNPSPALSTPAATAASSAPPNPNHPLPTLRTLPFSSIKVYKNGKYVGTPFTDLLAFLPLASKPLNQVGARDGLDDGMLGYFPAISVFRGGVAEVNFGPDFWYPPNDLHAAPEVTVNGIGTPNGAGADGDRGEDVDMLAAEKEPSGAAGAEALAGTDPDTEKQHALGKNSRLQGLGERYNEQIAEDIVWDIIDEVDFWWQDGCDSGDAEAEKGVEGAKGEGVAGGEVVDEMEGVETGALGGGGGGGEIKEIVQEE